MARIAPVLLVTAVLLGPAVPAHATPVCTDGYEGGPPLSVCGGRVFPEADNTAEYVQYLPDPATGFREAQHGLEFLAQTYPRWISVTTLRQRYGDQAVSVGPDDLRSNEDGDAGDGYDILVVKVTDHEVPDAGKQTLLFSLSVHGDEKGGLEGGFRAIEDLGMAAEAGGTIVDGIAGYPTSTGVEPVFHEYEVADVLKREAVYFVDFNADGWVAGDHFAPTPGIYTRGNGKGTDLNRQMPTVGWINPSRNPLEEREMFYGHKLMTEVAQAGIGGKMAYGADVHGEGQSRAFADIMYPAGQFDSVKHRQLMAIAERTKSVIDETLFQGLADAIEEATGGDTGEGIEDLGAPPNTVPTKPARWGTVWDTLGYTDTGFIGDYLANEFGVTGMDYEIALNHSDVRAYGRPWSVLLQENYINATRAIVKTAMAYALYQEQEFAGFTVDPGGRVGYLFNPAVVTDSDANGPGTMPEPANGEPIVQAPYRATNMGFFDDEAKYVVGGLHKVNAADIALDAAHLDRVDTLVLADTLTPADAVGRSYDRTAYLAHLKAWVERGGNLVLTDRALHALPELGLVADGAVSDIAVYQPYANFVDYENGMLRGLRTNARQLAEATVVGYGIGNEESPMSVVQTAAWQEAGGVVVGTTGPGSGASDDGSLTSVGELAVGKGFVRILGGGLAMPTEEHDHRYGLKDYGLTYSGLFILENAIRHDSPVLGNVAAAAPRPPARAPAPRPAPLPATSVEVVLLPLLLLGGGLAIRRRLR